MTLWQRLTSIWRPGAYHHSPRQEMYFEGWYVKLVSPDLRQRWAVIPGIFHHPDPDRSHAFIQVLNGVENTVDYHRFPTRTFQASRETFDVHLGDNRFWQEGCVLDLDGEGHHLQGELAFQECRPWPVRFTSPGVMGPYAFVPFMQTYHGVLSLNHALQGRLSIDGKEVDFSGGKGYMEKDWGTTFPRAYIWMQSNHFQREGVCLTASAATIPWLGSWFRGFLVGLWLEDRLYRFTTYLGSEIRSLRLTDEDVHWMLRGTQRTAGDGFPGYELEIRARRGEGGLLSSPELDGMTPRILESLTAEVEVTLRGLDREGGTTGIIFEGRGTCAGLEVAGSVQEIVEDDRGSRGSNQGQDVKNAGN